MNSLRRLLRPPVFADEQKTEQAYLLHIVLWVLILVPIPYVLFVLLHGTEDGARVLAQVGFGELANITLLVMLRYGYVRAASILQVSLFWLFFTATAATGSGVQGEAYLLGYGLVIAIAGMLIGGWGAALVTGLSLLSGWWMAYGQAQGLISTGYVSSPITTWIVSLVLFPVSAVLQYLSSRSLRKALTRARASEARYSNIIENAEEIVYTFNAQGNFLSVSPTWTRLLGHRVEEVVGRNFSEFVHPEDIATGLAVVQTVLTTGATQKGVEYRVRHKDGHWRWHSSVVASLKDESGRSLSYVGIAQDITNRRESEQRLKAERDLLQVFIDNIPDNIYFKDTESRFLRINRAQARFLKIDDPAQAIGKTDLDFQNPAIAGLFLEEERQILATGEAVVNRVEYNPREDGSARWLAATKQVIRDANGQALGIIGISRDITEQRQAQEKLQNVFQQQSAILNNIPDMAWLKDMDSRYIAVNEQFTKTAGKPIEEILGRTDREIWQAEFAEHYRQDDLQVIQSGERKHIEEYQADSTGRTYWVETTKTPIKDEHGNVIGTTGIARDITDRKQMEQREQQRRERLEMVIRLGKFVTETQGLRTTLQRIWQSVRNDIGFDRLGIYLYNPDDNSMNGTFGTSQQGEMIDESDQRIVLTADNPESIAFQATLREANGLYLTHAYEATLGRGNADIMRGVQDFAAVSAWMGDKPVAVLCVDNVITGRPITDHQIEALRLFAGYVGLALENARLNDALQKELVTQIAAEQREARRRETLEKIVQLGKQVAEVSDLRTTLERIWHGVHVDLGFDRLAIFLYDAATHSIRGTLGTTTDGQIVEEWHYERSLNQSEPTSFTHALAQPDGIYFTPNFAREFNIPAGHEMHAVREFAAVTAWGGDKPVAIITVDNQPSGRPITEEMLEALRLFAGYAGLAIENARLNDALQKELALRTDSEKLEVRRRTILEKVLQLGKRVARVTDLRTTLENIWQGVHDDLEFDRLAIFLYNPQDNVMDDTFGTDSQGNRVSHFGLSFPLSNDETDTSTFTRVLKTPEGLYFTHAYGTENRIPAGHEMYGVQDFVAVAVWAGDKPVAVICADNHISQRPITNEQLEALRLFSGYAGLAIENARLNTTLEADLLRRKTLIEELESKNAELERFTYTVSHDLKSPLVTIAGFLGFLEQDARSGNAERVQNTMQRITSAAHKMQALLNDLLELSRIGRLINPPEAVAFAEVVNEALDRVHGRLDELNAVIEIQTDLPTVHGDKVRLIEVLQNLVENAAKYSDPHRRIQPHIQIGAQATPSGQWIFHVRDNGIGIAPEYHEKIFGLFNKLDALTEGTGIGLTIVKRIVEVHGGRIWVESSPGAGATFYFTLPVTSPEK